MLEMRVVHTRNVQTTSAITIRGRGDIAPTVAKSALAPPRRLPSNTCQRLAGQ
jgi:hypothetical protein